jgi:hypothetical protein
MDITYDDYRREFERKTGRRIYPYRSPGLYLAEKNGSVSNVLIFGSHRGRDVLCTIPCKPWRESISFIRAFLGLRKGMRMAGESQKSRFIRDSYSIGIMLIIRSATECRAHPVEIEDWQRDFDSSCKTREWDDYFEYYGPYTNLKKIYDV